MTFSFWGKCQCLENPCAEIQSENYVFISLHFPLKGNSIFLNFSFSQKEHLSVVGKVPTEDGVPTPSSVPGLPGLDQELGELCHLPCLCTWCRKPWTLRLLLEFGLSDSWLQCRESGSFWAHSRLTDRKWASVWYFDFAEVENWQKSCFLGKFTCQPYNW